MLPLADAYVVASRAAVISSLARVRTEPAAFIFSETKQLAATRQHPSSILLVDRLVHLRENNNNHYYILANMLLVLSEVDVFRSRLCKPSDGSQENTRASVAHLQRLC
jgi:hypothetical protein